MEFNKATTSIEPIHELYLNKLVLMHQERMEIIEPIHELYLNQPVSREELGQNHWTDTWVVFKSASMSKLLPALYIEPIHELYLNNVVTIKTINMLFIEPIHELYLNTVKKGADAKEAEIEPIHELYLNSMNALNKSVTIDHWTDTWVVFKYS